MIVKYTKAYKGPRFGGGLPRKGIFGKVKNGGDLITSKERKGGEV